MRPAACLTGPSCGLCFTRRLDLAELIRDDDAARGREQRMLAAIAAAPRP